MAAGLRETQRTGSLHVLVALLLPIPVLLLAHQTYLRGMDPFASNRWAVDGDHSWIEVFGYLQIVVAGVLLFLLGWWRRQGLVYIGWQLTLAVIVFDDALLLHELGGGWLVRQGVIPRLLGLPEQAVGELVAWGLMGIPALLVLWGTHRVSPARARQDSWRLAGLVGLLMVFAVGVDAVHELIQEVTDSPVVNLLVNFVEAGGEVGAMSALLAYVVHITRRGGSNAVAQA